MEIFGLMVFNTTHCAIKAETLIKEGDFKARLIGTPESIVAGCGLSLKFELEDLDQIRNVIDANNIEYKGLFKGQKEGFKSEYSPLDTE